jgi:guanine deaminase
MVCALEALRSGATTIVDDMSLGQGMSRAHVDAALQAYEDAGVRALVGFSMIDKPVIDSFPFVDECFDPALAAELRALPRPDGDALLALVRNLARHRHPRTTASACSSRPRRRTAAPTTSCTAAGRWPTSWTCR